MSNDERAKLIDQANELNLEFASNIPTTKLQGLIDEALGNTKNDEKPKPSTTKVVLNPEQIKRKRIADRKKDAMKTRVVTITNKDPRENTTTTTASLQFENQYFGISKIVPLDVPVELEQALIGIAESSIITQHKDEVIDGKRTGNKVPVPTKRYVVSYEKETK